MKRKLIGPVLTLLMLAPLAANAQTQDPLVEKLVEKGALTRSEADEVESKKTELPDALKGLSIGALAYIDYSFGEKGGNDTTFSS